MRITAFLQVTAEDTSLLRPTAHRRAHNSQLRCKLKPWLHFPSDAINSNIVEDIGLLKAVFFINN